MLPGFQLHLAGFEGPLDVLLRLIEEHRLEITTLSLVAVTDGFVAYVSGLVDPPPALLAEFISVAARLLVNAAGPWVDKVLALTAGSVAHNVRLVQGSHIVIRRKFDDPRAFFFQNKDGRIIFAIPYEQDFTLIDNGPSVVISPFVGINYWQETVDGFGARCNRDDIGGALCGPPGSVAVSPSWSSASALFV